MELHQTPILKGPFSVSNALEDKQAALKRYLGFALRRAAAEPASTCFRGEIRTGRNRYMNDFPAPDLVGRPVAQL